MFVKKLKQFIYKINTSFRLRRKQGYIFFINGTAVLPPPLTAEEEENCFRKLSAGEPSARETLIVHNLRLVVYIAKKFENSGVPSEDLVSIGTIGLIKAVRTFSPEKNIKLATYASRCIENEILMYLRKTANRKSEISLDEPLNVDRDGNELLLSDILFTEDDIVTSGVENEEEIRTLIRCVSGLSERDKRIIYLRFGFNNSKEFTQKEVADMLGISQSYISRIEKKIIKRLKNDIEKMTAQN